MRPGSNYQPPRQSRADSVTLGGNRGVEQGRVASELGVCLPKVHLTHYRKKRLLGSADIAQSVKGPQHLREKARFISTGM